MAQSPRKRDLASGTTTSSSAAAAAAAAAAAREGGIFDDASHDVHDVVGTPPSKRQRKDSDMDASNTSEDEDLFASSPPKANGTNQPFKATNSDMAERRAGLSKFVRRILDPHRKPTGLIEPPQIIPLNDEFLQAFGKREKEFDAQVGRDPEIDQAIVDDDDDDDNKNATQAQADAPTAESETEHTKVKITNLKYTMPAQVLEEECLNFGSVVEVNLIMDESDPDGLRNAGRAYVTFETAKAAHDCVDQQMGGNLEGRPVRVSLAENFKKSGGGGASSSSNTNRDEKRYWQKDISTKCFRCGQVGHMGAECPNPAKAQVCPLCAQADQHELRFCPLNRVCFNCGIPGHINRECAIPRGSQPPRQVCTICCGSGHVRRHCQRSATNVPGMQDAICCVCQQKGHFMCRELKWFFGLDGVFCYNCGGRGHVGDLCNRPNLEDLSRNTGAAMRELERAEEYKLTEDVELERAERQRKEQERERERRDRRDRDRDHYRNRAKSAPPPNNRGYNQESYDDFTGGYNAYGGGGGGGGEYRFTVGEDNNSSGNNNNNNNNNNRRNNNNNNNNNQRGYRGQKRGY